MKKTSRPWNQQLLQLSKAPSGLLDHHFYPNVRLLRLMSAEHHDMDPEVLPEATTFSTVEFRDCIGFPLGDLLVIQSPKTHGGNTVNEHAQTVKLIIKTTQDTKEF